MTNKCTYTPGSYVWLRSGLSGKRHPAIIKAKAEYDELHDDGMACSLYYADVFFPHETVEGGLVSHCMLSPREEEEKESEDL